jgi:hypothetical protein
VKTLHTVTAVLELGVGLALLCCPSATTELLVGAPLEAPVALSVARVGGAGLLALGVACWFARGDTQSRTARGLVVAMLLYDVAAVAILAFAGIGFGLHGVGLWPVVSDSL